MKFIRVEQNGAHERKVLPSCSKGRPANLLLRDFFSKAFGMTAICVLCAGAIGCGTSGDQPAQTAAKPAEPAIPDDVQAAATALLGKDTTVLIYGDLAKTGTRQLLAVNLVPKTPKDTVAGTIITRAVIAEDTPEGWHELVRCDEHLKNAKGYLGGSPIEPVSGWKIQFEKTDVQGLNVYLIPIKGTLDPHVLPLALRWNSAVKRYQTLDRNYEHFLPEVATLGPAARSHF
jgi:hypothetical protein